MTGLLGQSIRFVMVGVANTTIGLAAIYALMFFLGISPAIANAAGYTIGLGLSFLLNRIWTFKNTTPIRKVLPRYILVAAICYTLNLAMVMTGIEQFNVNIYIAQLGGIFIYTTTMFLACRYFVFTSRVTC